jgi:hypothetical protein
MSEEDAFRERLAAMSPDQVAQLYDATAEDWAKIGISKEVFQHNIGVRSQYDAAVRPFEVVYEAYLAMSDREAVRIAKRDYAEALEALRFDNPANKRIPVAELRERGQAAKLLYDAAIELAGDQRVIEAKRAYDAAVVAASDRFGDDLR